MPWCRSTPRPGRRALRQPRLHQPHLRALPTRARMCFALLYEQLASREFTVRFRWEPGSVAFWDNRATAHRAPLDVPVGHRSRDGAHHLAGDRLIGPTGFTSQVFGPC
ncbi:MAG: TauD/TfdA family dioxygenase [Acidimicrobiales bacterium]